MVWHKLNNVSKPTTIIHRFTKAVVVVVVVVVGVKGNKLSKKFRGGDDQMVSKLPRKPTGT